ncbi:MmcB family DNA repair protein [Sphingomonas montana]|uniref:MmcB family DNA repair protein n=1 Tax=Sphingomonas montana TaxID=1843236 RepID=UPI00096C1D0D|nr:MmcB family DNA repair protein [Sphingomonas montana]
MATAPSCFDDSPLVARDVARGVARLLFRQDAMALCEVPLGNGRRADLMAIGPKGEVVIVEVKVSRADLRGDAKWPEYLDYCDRYYWAVPAGFDLAPFGEDAFLPDVCGLIVADRYDAETVRAAAVRPMAAARRRVETLRFARRAARRLLGGLDPGLVGLD